MHWGSALVWRFRPMRKESRSRTGWRLGARRRVVRSLFTGSMLFPAVLQQLFADGGGDTLAERAPHFPAKAKRVIFMYMPGGASHVDSFDYKPKLIAAAEAKGKAPNGRLYVKPPWAFK